MRSTRSTWARSTADLVLAKQPGRHDPHPPVGTGLVTHERAARLCGDHSEHAYDVLRLTTHGTACTSVCYHSEVPDILVCGTAFNSIAQYDIARSACISHQTKGPKRCSHAHNPCVSHVAVYGDPVVPAIELQLCHCGKFTWLEGHTAEVRCCSVSLNGSLLVSGGRNGQAFLWLVQQPAGPSSEPVLNRFRLQGHDSGSQVKACCISANCMWAATGSTDGQVLLWDLSGIQRYGITCNSDGSAADPPQERNDSAAEIFNKSSLKPAATFTLPREKAGDYATALDISSNSNWLAIGSRTGKVYLIYLQQQQLQLLPLRHQDGSKVRCCAFSPDASKLATTADDGRMVLWDIASNSWVLSVHEHFKPVHGCCWSPDGRKIVTAGMDALICVMDIVLLVNQHKLRIPLRLYTGNTAAAPDSLSGVQRAATAAQAQDGAFAGSISMSRANTAHEDGRQQHPLLRKSIVTEAGRKLLACVPVLQQNKRLRSHQSQIFAASTASGDMQEAVLCADQAGNILVQLLGQQTAVATELSIGSSVYCCSFDGTVVAAAKRDGAVTALSCSTAVLEGSSNVDNLVTLEAQSSTPVAVSAKLNMLVNGVSIYSQLGRVALVGTGKKLHQTGVLWLWEYDPSVRPAGSCDNSEADDFNGFGGFDALIDRLGSKGSGMLSSGESRVPSIGSPRGMSDSATLQDSSGVNNTAHLGDVNGESFLKAQRSGYGAGSPTAAAIGPHGWLWKCENPVKVLTVADTPLQCCAFAKGTSAKLVVGTSAGWLAVVNLAGEEMEETWTRYQIHTCEVTAVDFASDAATLVSGSADGRVIMWSHVTGFKLAVWTMHSAAIRTVAFNIDATLVAVGDAAGVISSWDIRQSCLVTAAQAHDGPVTTVNWLNSANSECMDSLVSCGNDGAVAILHVDPGIYKLYRAAFWGLYHSCKRSHKIHKLETAITWHLAQGALQDASVLQLLVNTAAADGNVVVLSMLLPLFERMGWLLHLGPVIAGPPPSSLKKIDSDKSMGLGRKSSFQAAPATAPVKTAVPAGDISEYAIHPHDRIPDTANSSRGHSRRNTKEAKKEGHVSRHTRQESFAFASSAGALVDGGARSSRWTHSVADIGRLMAFQGQHQRAQQLQQQHTGAPSSPGIVAAAATAAAAAAGSLPASNSLAECEDNSRASGISHVQDQLAISSAADAMMGSEPDSPRGFDSSGNGTSPSITPQQTPTRLLSPINSRNARTPAVLPSLDTLHEEHHMDPSAIGITSLDDLALSVRNISTDHPAADDATNASATPQTGSLLGANDDGCGAQSNISIPCQGIADITGPDSDGGSQAEGDSSMQCQRSSSSHGGSTSLSMQLADASSPSQPRQQQQSHRPSMGRQLLSFLSGKRITASSGGFGDAAGSDAGDAAGSQSAVRQRSLSEGASLAQRVNALRSMKLHSSEVGSNSCPGSAGNSPLAREQHPLITAALQPEAKPESAFASIVTAAAAAAAAARIPDSDNAWESSAGPLQEEDRPPLSPANSRRQSLQSLLTRFMSSRRSRQASGKSSAGALDLEAATGQDLAAAPSGFSALSEGSNLGVRPLGSSGRKLAQLFSWRNWRRSSKSYTAQPISSDFLTQPQQPAPAKSSKERAQKVDLLQIAMASQQAQCVRLVVDALLAGRFSKMSVVLHMYDALQALIHDPQHKRACRRLLKHLPMIDNGEVEVDSLLTNNTTILYKCSANGHPGNIWASAASGQQPLLDALDVLMKRASWRDSIAALLMWPVLWSLKHLGAAWLWLWARQGLKFRNRVQVSATSKLVPVARAAEICVGSKGNLLRQLVSANVDADLYGKELVRAIINVKWDSFARAFLLMQGVQFVAFVILFLAYLSVAVYGCDPEWSIAELLASSQGRAAVVLECILMFMMFGQAADEAKQIATYGREYFNSPWNYMDVASCVIIAILFLLHISRLNHQLFVILMALEVLLLCLRSLYFCMALDQIGALLRMVLIVIKDMRYFFMMLVFLLISFGLTFSVLMSPTSKARLNIISAVASSEIDNNTAEVQVFGSLEDSMTQLFTIMFGDVQFSTLKTIMNVNTVASRLAVVLACVYAVLVLIVLVNLLIAIVDETYGTVKESEADQMLRNKALIIDEIESTLTDAVIKDLNGRVLLPYVHILIPQAARADQHTRRRDLHAKFRKLKTFLKQRLQEQAVSGSLSLDTVSGHSPMMSTTSAIMAPVAGGNWQLQLQRRVSAGASQPPLNGLPAANSRSDGAEALAALAVGKLQQEMSQLSTSVLAFDRQLEAVSSSNAVAVAELTAKVETMQSDINQVKDLLLALVSRQQD